MPSAAYVNGYRGYDFKQFAGGLNLRDKSDAVDDGQAIDLLNVTFTDRGAIRQRDGYVDLTSDLAQRVDSMVAHYTTAGARQLMLGAGPEIDVVNEIGAVIGTQAGLTQGPWVFAQFGDPTRELVFCANGADPITSWNGAAFTLGATAATLDGVAAKAMPKAGAVCVTASTPGFTSATNASNRLVATAFGSLTTAGPGGAQSTPSRVFFSNPGQPFIWETDGDLATGRGRNYIDLTPGDGEYIMAAVAWRELVFIFKQTKFFVLWGEGIGSTGTPTFQVREIVNSVGLASPQAVAVGRDGVYFMNRRGVYRTSGGDPVLLSDIVSPMWEQDTEVYFRSLPINLARLDRPRMLWHQERVYLAVPTGLSTVNDRVLVYDTQHEWWTLYDLPASALASFRSGDQPEVHFGYSTGPQRVGHLVLDQETDRGQPITSRWRSGWGDYDSSQVKTLRESKVWGDGVALVSFSVDFNNFARASLQARFRPHGPDWTYARLTAQGGMYSDLALTYATYTDLTGVVPLNPVVGSVLLRYATRGTVFSTEFANDPAEPTWRVSRITRHMREVREPSVLR